MSTKIEWTDETWNPIAGCNDVSEGCRHCYARGMARRLGAMGQAKYTGLTVLQGSHVVWTGKISFDEKVLLAPLRRKKPTRYFVNSMSDLFHPNVTDEQIDRIFAVMALCPQHTFQVLTKRPERMGRYLNNRTSQGWPNAASLIGRWNYWIGKLPHKVLKLSHLEDGDTIIDPLPNVWLGVSVESQKAADERIPLLLQTPAAVRFLSCEPLLGAVDLDQFFIDPDLRCGGFVSNELSEGGYCQCGGHESDPCHHSPSGLIDWVICGGESGAGARPMHPEWARSLRDQCQAAGVPFFFKQWGEYREPREGERFDTSNGRAQRIPAYLVGRVGTIHCFHNDETKVGAAAMLRVGKKAAGRLLDGREWNEFPGMRA